MKPRLLAQREKELEQFLGWRNWGMDCNEHSPTHPDPPVVTLSAEPQTVQEGQKVTFLCQATAQPPVTGYR